MGYIREALNKLEEDSEKEYYYNYDVLFPIYYKGGVIHRDEEAYAKSYEDLCKQVKDDWVYDDDLEDVEKYGSIKVKVNYSDDPKFKSEDDEGDLDEGCSKDKDLEETSPYTNIKSNGIYSLNTGWVKHPVQQDIPDIDMEEFEKEFKVWEDKYFDLLDKESSKEEIDNLIEDIYNLRQEGLQEPDGEYSIKNLIFKEFRNLDYLDNLKELKKKEISKDLSLESIIK